MKKFKVSGINCQNCANLIKNGLADEFGNVDVNVEKGEISLEIEDKDVTKLSQELDELGFEFKSEIK